MSHQEHLEAVYSAQLALGGVGGQVRGASETHTRFDALLILAVGVDPGPEPAKQAAALSRMLGDALADAVRLADRIDDLLSDYRKAL